MLFHRPKRWTIKPPIGAKVSYGHPLFRGLVGLWTMREGGGLLTADAISNSRSTLVGGTTWVTGRSGTALSFDGTDDVVNTGPVFSFSNNFTASMWIKRTAAIGTFRMFFSNGVDGDTGWSVYVNGTDHRFLKSAVAAISSGINSPLNVWEHVTWTVDSLNKPTLYINGVSKFASADTSGMVAPTGTRYIGSDQAPINTATNFWPGQIDDVRVYNRVLTAGEIQRTYARPYEIFIPQSPTFGYRVATSGIEFDAASNSGLQTAQTTYDFNRTVTGTNRFLAVDVSILSAGQTVTSVVDDVAGGAVAMTFIGARSTVTSFGRIETWGLAAPASGTKSIRVTLSGSVTSVGMAVSYKNVHQTSPFEAFNSNQGTNVGAADATVDITPIADQTWIHAAIATDDASVTAGQTSRNNVSGGATLSGADEDKGPISPAAATTMSYTGVGALATWAIAGYAIRPISASSPAFSVFNGSGFFQLLGVGT